MTPEDYRRLRELFLNLYLKPAGERTRLFAEVTARRPDLRTELASLLAEHDALRSFLEEPPRLPAEATEVPGDHGPAPPPARIGSYRILSVLGEGGMGVVYRAEQENPRRTVALKVIRPGACTARALRRFEHEAQLLGRLQHPGIAQIFEAGRADAGAGLQPFFAMELVEGRPLHRYAREEGLGNRRRLELLADVCDAVQHAHQRGVIHRDLKPGNILVDAGGRPKVLDFGVARATEPDAQLTLERTGVGLLAGTVPYMSPEQATADPDLLDTRSDVYALGVIGYELLAGRLPHDLDGKSVLDAVRVIREEEPTPLSSVSRVFRGDVATIFGKALEKERARRYQSASELCSELRRYLRNEPIVARPASALYQMRKFALRNRALVVGLAAAIVALVAGIVGVSLSLVRARSAERLAVRTNEFLKRTLTSGDPRKSGKEMRVFDVLETAAGEIDAAFAGEPEARADLHATLGITLQSLGFFAESERELAAALRVLADLRGEDHPDTLAARHNLATVMGRRGSLREAEDILVAVLDRQSVLLGREAEPTLATMNILASIRRERGNLRDAEPLLREVKAARSRRAAESSDAMSAGSNLGQLLGDQAKWDEAEEVLRGVMDQRTRIQGEDHPDRVMAMQNVAFLLHRRGRLAEAESLYRAALAKAPPILGEEHPDTLMIKNNFARLLEGRGKLGPAEKLFRNVLDARTRVLGEDSPETIRSLNNLASLLQVRGKLDEAESLLQNALERSRAAQGPEHPLTLTVRHNVGSLLLARKQLTEAEPHFREVLAARARLLVPEHPDSLQTMNSLAFLLQGKGELAEAESLHRRVLEATSRSRGADHPDALVAASNLGILLQDRRELAEAEALFRRTLDGLRATVGDEHHFTFSALNNLGNLLREKGDLAEAEPLLQAALALGRRTVGDEHENTLTTMDTLAFVLRKRGQPDAAEALARECLETRARARGRDEPATVRSRLALAELLVERGNRPDARALADAVYELVTERGRGLPTDIPRRLLGLLVALEESGKAGELRSLLGQPAEAAHTK